MIPYALGFPNTYVIVVKGVEAPIKLNQSETVKTPFRDISIQRCENDLCLEMLRDDKTAILTISSFNYYPWNNLDVFKKFIDSSLPLAILCQW